MPANQPRKLDRIVVWGLCNMEIAIDLVISRHEREIHEEIVAKNRLRRNNAS